MRKFKGAMLLPVSVLFLTGFAAAQSPSLDVIGIKLGEPMSDAIQALKADNPRMKITSSTFKYAAFTNPLTLEVDGNDTPATENDQVTHATETVQLVFTTPPNQPGVWAIRREYEFPTSQRPSSQTIMASLRQKYGPETIPPGTPMGEQTLTWVFDPQGKLVTTGGAQMNTMCGSVLGTFLAGPGAGGQAENIAIASAGTPQWPQQCTSMIVLTAMLQIEQVAPNQYATKVLRVSMQDGGRYMKALAATKAVVAGAAKAQQDQKTKQMNQVGAPKL